MKFVAGLCICAGIWLAYAGIQSYYNHQRVKALASEVEAAALRDGNYANAYLFSAAGAHLKPPWFKMLACGTCSVLAFGAGFTILQKKK
ncbi:MAG: hypothetical protein WCQ21_11350 [Verrucomicrobiota bacterium]